MSKHNNDNVNEVSLKPNDNDNVERKYARERQVEQIADRLLDQLKLDTSSRPFMCKVARKLAEHRIWDNLDTAQRSAKQSVPGLFIYLCKRDGV